MEKIKSLFRSEGFLYLFFGGLATLVYIIVKFITWRAWSSGWESETVAQASSIIFAFFTNKFFVFKHKSGNIFKEFLTFVSGRVVLLLFAIVLNWWFIDQHPSILMQTFGWNKNFMVTALNAFIQVFTIVVNYLYSKFIVFRKKKKPVDD